MPERKLKTRYLLFLVFVSFSTLSMLAAIAFLSPRDPDGFAGRQQVTGSIFSILCLLGMVAVFFPQRCGRSAYNEHTVSGGSDYSVQKESDLKISSSIGSFTVMHGHHPTCNRYRQHEFVLGEKTLCSACMGLFFGALIAFAGAWYFFLMQRPSNLPDGIIFAVGAVGIVCGIAPYVVADPLGPIRRFSFNALMITGMLLALVGVDSKAHSIALNALLICFFVFTIFTRISLSQDKHERICATCGQACVADRSLRSAP